MDGSRQPAIDYQAAAEACLVALSSIALKAVTVRERQEGLEAAWPVTAVRMCKAIFPWEVRKTWTHESQRRRVREAVAVARQLIRQRGQALVISGNWAGYWITEDPKAMAEYAARRRRKGLRDLAAAGQAKRTIAEVGQGDLFGAIPPPQRH